MNFAPDDQMNYSIMANSNTYVEYMFTATAFNTNLHARAFKSNGSPFWARANAEEVVGYLKEDQYGQRPALHLKE